MQKRLQTVGDDTVLEIIEDKPQKRRLSLKTLLADRDRLTESIARFQAALAKIDASLALITDAQNEEAKRK